MINTILVATDGSEHAHKALELATEIAGGHHARMVLLHVRLRDATPQDVRKLVDVSQLPEGMQEEIALLESIPLKATSISGTYANIAVPVTGEILDAVGTCITNSARKEAAEKGVETISTVVVGGDPAKRILETAKAEGADMIFMGNRGFGDLKGLLMGSVSHKVSHLSECTCVTVK